MKSDNPVFQIASLLLMFGPIVLFWYVDWYWIVGYYNLFFTYTCYVLYKQYDSDSNYRRKYHFIIYVGLPLIFSFIGLLISVINGFEEIKEGDKDFNKNHSKSNDEGLSIQNDSIVESNKEFKSAINNIDVENLDSFSVDIIMSKWSTYEELTYDGEFEGYGYELTGGIANKWTKHLGCYTNNLVGLLNDVGDNELYQLDSKLKYDSTNFDEEPDYTFIEKINWNEGTPKNIKEEIEENYSSNDYEKLISKTNPNETFGDIEFFNKKQSNLFQIIVKYEQGGVEKSIIWSDREHEEGKCRDCKCDVKSHIRFCESCETKNETKNLKLIKKEDDSKEEIPKNAKKINNEKDLIQELGRIHDLLGPKEYKKEAYNLWRDFFLKKYDESEEKDGWEIGQEANSVMFDMYEVEFVSFFLNNKESGDTETMDIRFPFKILENEKAALIYNFPFKYDQITSYSSGSFYQLDDVWGSLNGVCKSLSELELIDFNKLSQKEKIQLFKPNRDDYS